jgi:valyl-tRNA synthetase
MALVGDLKLLIPLKGLIDVDAELARLDREIARVGKEVPRLEGKLGDPAFIGKAPAAVVEKERNRLRELTASVSELEAQRRRISALL